MISLTDVEKNFLIGCILIGSKEGFYIFDRGIVDDDSMLNEAEVIDLMKRLGANKEQIDYVLNS